MNFFRLIIITLFIFISSQKVFSDSHDAIIVEKAKEINKQIKEKQTQTQQSLNQELVEEEPLPLNDPFAGDASTASTLITNEPTNASAKLRSYKLVASFNGTDQSFATLVDDSGEFLTLELDEELSNGLKLVDVNLKHAVFEKDEDSKFLIINFKNQIKEVDEY